MTCKTEGEEPWEDVLASFDLIQIVVSGALMRSAKYSRSKKGGDVAIRIHDDFLPGTAVLAQGDQCHLSFRDTVTWGKTEIALCRGCYYWAVLISGSPFSSHQRMGPA